MRSRAPAFPLAAALALTLCLFGWTLPASAATISILAIPPVTDLQPWASGLQAEADLPGLGGYDVRAEVRGAASLTDSFSLAVPARPSTLVDTSFHFFQVGLTFSRTYRGRFDLYAGAGYAWEHSDYHTINFAGFGTAGSGSSDANGPTAELGIRLPLGSVGQLEAGVMALFASPAGQLCDAQGHCALPDTRTVLTYPYFALGVHF
ncbi:MAG TPA: hypothetical protein VNJ51_09695 [Candidatus Dormibacteraeota bacterium]|nr:hypothetical protein [Candidatus Dormibacteraeota bacterium]